MVQVANLLPIVETSDAIGQETKEKLYKGGERISLIWGNEHIGLDHLIRGRSKQFNIEEFLKDFSFIIKNGKRFPNKYSDTRFDLWNKKKKKLIVIETIFGQGKKINFPVTMVRQKNTPKR